jgi:hypothetical protein
MVMRTSNYCVRPDSPDVAGVLHVSEDRRLGRSDVHTDRERGKREMSSLSEATNARTWDLGNVHFDGAAALQFLPCGTGSQHAGFVVPRASP